MLTTCIKSQDRLGWQGVFGGALLAEVRLQCVVSELWVVAGEMEDSWDTWGDGVASMST